MIKIFYWLPLLLLTGCVNQNVKPGPSSPALSLTEALAKPEAVKGQEVEWGGSIVAVQNGAKSTRLEIVYRSLNRDRRPKHNDKTEGRFIAVVDGFLDPEVYSRGRDITVEGKVSGSEFGMIGQYPYQFIVVHVKDHRLWKKQKPVEVRYIPDPIDPWFFRPYYRPYPPLYW